MKILVVGNGGREHALVWKLARDSAQPEIYCAPGNAGTARHGINIDIGAEAVEDLLQWAVANRPDLTVVGPEAPLCRGIVDMFEQQGLPIFGPSQAAARIEGSKVFAKELMESAGVPTAEFGVFADPEKAREYIKSRGAPVVVKADGLASGKGVFVCKTIEEADAALNTVMVKKAFGDAGDRVVVEDCLSGQEASVLALVDGTSYTILDSSQDHKRAYDNDEGPNTGGMGAYSPTPVIPDDLWPVICGEIFENTLAEFEKRKITYRGVLYAGLILNEAGASVLEFNCRFGDPETQVIVPGIEGDLLPALDACRKGNLAQNIFGWKENHRICVVLASGGYPGPYSKGKRISGLNEVTAMDDVVAFHAGTALEKDEVVTAGGRVLGLTAWAGDLSLAIKRVYAAVEKVDFDGMHYRRDIGQKALGYKAG
jgi:phosphoribosylamine--glycine ligase